MLDERPTFVSVELAANEVLRREHGPGGGNDAVRRLGARLRPGARGGEVDGCAGGARGTAEQRGEVPEHPVVERVLQPVAGAPRARDHGEPELLLQLEPAVRPGLPADARVEGADDRDVRQRAGRGGLRADVERHRRINARIAQINAHVQAKATENG